MSSSQSGSRRTGTRISTTRRFSTQSLRTGLCGARCSQATLTGQSRERRTTACGSCGSGHDSSVHYDQLRSAA